MPEITLSRTRLPVLLFVVCDVLLVMLSALLVMQFHFGQLIGDGFHYYAVIVIQALVVVICSFFSDIYLAWRGLSLKHQLTRVVLAWLFSFGFIIVFTVLTKTAESFSRLWLCSWIVISIAMALSFRMGVYLLLAKLRTDGRNNRSILLVGRGKHFELIQKTLAFSNIWGYQVKRVIFYMDTAKTLERIKGLSSGGTGLRKEFDECWLCLPLKDSGFVKELMNALRHETVNVRFIPDVQDMSLLNHKVTHIAGFYSLDLSCSPMDTLGSITKRIEDLVLGTLISLFILPVCFVIAVTIKLTSRGPVLFKQRRHGYDSKTFKVYKFRSMYVHCEAQGRVTQTTKGDKRLTPIGAFLRKTSLDELPQFFNVLQGRMSIVGPRPHALAHNEYYKDTVVSYMKRHKMKPGITGLAQVSGFRGETDTVEKMKKRVACDLEYINNWSLWLDIKIILKTIMTGFIHKNAY